ncbi:hypothetical protein BCR24_09350 [Enterococcus ureilyticus]|uniref:Uncharacterized protein n=1 Tax=Enterococcus ureilyticus TaxID=1131292 RepID=A0A1E5H578_9ENTE|nr:hypothetical protein [Enterococcus ureilyticus]MBM7689087.1 hypothetical protein [Enterococcus ureilyticus]OEG20119.1 hypothetical protein BCR24_09350 [Enterococcus ureilyticus]
MNDREKILKEFTRPRNWSIRDEIAKIQVLKYKENLTAENHVQQVKRSIQEWIIKEKPNKLMIADNLPILVSDMNKEEVKKEIMKRSGEKEKYHYLWVSFRDNGMIVTIGRTSFSKKSGYGDLFDPFDIFGTGTQKLIVTFLIDSEEAKKEMERINAKMNSFTTYALIIPVNSDESKIVNNLERQLGEYLIKRYPVFNYYSHNW